MIQLFVYQLLDLRLLDFVFVEIEFGLIVVIGALLLIFPAIVVLLDESRFLLVLFLLTLLFSLQVFKGLLPFILNEQFLSLLDVQLLTFGEKHVDLLVFRVLFFLQNFDGGFLHSEFFLKLCKGVFLLL